VEAGLHLRVSPVVHLHRQDTAIPVRVRQVVAASIPFHEILGDRRGREKSDSLLENPFSHEPEGVGREEGGDCKNPEDVP
jgi:hypothetical protein